MLSAAAGVRRARPQLPAAACRRLLRDYREYSESREALPTIAAEPAGGGDDLSTWHCTLTAPEGPYRGAVFHLVLTFPDAYPQSPPVVKLCTELPHPNVYAGYDMNQHKSMDDDGHYLCLNMLRPYEGSGHYGESYSGWSSSYTVTSLLMQLSSFLFAERIEQDYGGSEQAELGAAEVASAVQAARRYHAAHGADFPELQCAKSMKVYDSFAQPALRRGDGGLFVLSSGSPLPSMAPVTIKPACPACAQDSVGARFGMGSSLPPPPRHTCYSDRAPDWTADERGGGGGGGGSLQVSPDGLGIRALPAGSNYASAVGTTPVTGSFYFEMTVEDAAPRAVLRLGVAIRQPARQQRSSAPPQLGVTGNSYGYGCTGKKVHDGEFEDYGIAFGAGDTVGCVVERCASSGAVSLSFAVNGRQQGAAFIFHSREPLLPVVSLKPAGANSRASPTQVFLNFGQHPFEHIDRDGIADGEPTPETEEEVEPATEEEVEEWADVVTGRACTNATCTVGVCLCRALGATPAFVYTTERRLVGTTIRRIATALPLAPAAGGSRRPSLAISAVSDTSSEGKFHKLVKVVAAGGADDASGANGLFELLPEELLLRLLVSLQPSSLAAARSSCPLLCQLTEKFCVWQRREAICFHSKLTVSDPDVVLGVGITVAYHRGGRDIQHITPQLDLLSAEAYAGGVRRGVWNEEFNGFCPLWLDDTHGERAYGRIAAYVNSVTGRSGPAAALEFFGKAMNTFVVSMLQMEDEPRSAARHGPAQPSGLHASERALQGYCAFHHLLLAFCARRPEMRKEANRRVDGLLKGNCTKAAIPDIGVLLALLSVTDRTWRDGLVAWAVLGETLDRNVRWLLRDHPYLRRGLRLRGEAAGCNLLSDWLGGTKTSMRVLMFQAYFLQHIGRPAGKQPMQILSHYNRSFGRPSPKAVEELRLACAEIVAVDSWQEFFQRLGLSCPARSQVEHRLLTAVENSGRKGYHR